MKAFYGALLVVVLMAVVGAAVMLIAQSIPNETSFQASTPPAPKYTIDQVIYIVQAKYPVGYKRERIGDVYQTIQTPTSVTATYVGGTRAVWKVEVSVPFGYSLGSPTSFVSKRTLYFYESDASLRDEYYP